MTTQLHTRDTGQEPAATHRWWVLGVLVVSLLLAVLDPSILNVALNTLAEPAPQGLGASSGALQWAVDAHPLAFAALLLGTGVLADRGGRRRTLVACLAVLGLCSLWFAHTGGSGELIAARTGLGVGGALVPRGAALADRAVGSFVSAMHTTAPVAAAVTFAGTLVSLFLLPSRARDASAGPAPAARVHHSTEV
ncbi:MFS transporter [Streptomyces sp. cg36]|uniref:MFS transporter n=1 Tax=Streptomyces sp. cg36 TaxID=3238798 RepID=UPI0034E2E6B8